MAVDDRARYALHNRLREVLGEDEATTLMAALSPFSWDEVATRADLERLRIELRGDTEALAGSLRSDMEALAGSLRGDMAGQTRMLVFAIVGSNATLVALAFAAARLA
jgi:hypothetical protein